MAYRGKSVGMQIVMMFVSSPLMRVTVGMDKTEAGQMPPSPLKKTLAAFSFW